MAKECGSTLGRTREGGCCVVGGEARRAGYFRPGTACFLGSKKNHHDTKSRSFVKHAHLSPPRLRRLAVSPFQESVCVGSNARSGHVPGLYRKNFFANAWRLRLWMRRSARPFRHYCGLRGCAPGGLTLRARIAPSLARSPANNLCEPQVTLRKTRLPTAPPATVHLRDSCDGSSGSHWTACRGFGH
jgi:hypothetical protein